MTALFRRHPAALGGVAAAFGTVLCAGSLLAGTYAVAQSTDVSAPVAAASRTDSVVVLDIVFTGDLANALQASDSLVAPEATSRLRAALAGTHHLPVVDPERTKAAIASPEAAAAAGGKPCAFVSACVRVAAEAVGARWAVTGELTKISNLVWGYHGQLRDLATGRLLMNDTFEVKGAAADMAPMGASVFARRVAEKIGDVGPGGADRATPHSPNK